MSSPAPRPRRRRLGRGLDALLAGAPAAEQSADGALIELDPETVQPNPEQPRTHFDAEALASLAESLQLHGLLQPIVVEPVGSGYRLVAGERRLRAARLAHLTSIPALVRPASDSGRHALELALTENLLRTDLSPMEEAGAYARLADAFGLSHDAIALRVGRSRPVVTNTIRLLALPAPVHAAVAEGRITAGHARALLGLASGAAQDALARQIEAEGLTVRETERLIQREVAPAAGKRAANRAREPAQRAEHEAMRRGLESVIGTAVRLERQGRGGRVVIDYQDDEDLQALYARLGGPRL